MLLIEQKILNFLEKYITLSEEEKTSIIKILPYKTFKKGSYLLLQGSISKECFFNVQGLVRQFEIIDGEEKTTDFYTEGDAIVAFDSAAKRTPSTFSWVCEEDTTLVIGRLDKIDDVYAQHPKLEKMSALFINQEFGKYQNLSSIMITLNPEQRYLHMLEKQPDLVNRVPQYHLASFLGIKPETLSRIRKRISERK